MGILDSLAAASDSDFNEVEQTSSAGSLLIDMDDIRPDPEQPRKEFDQALIDTMAAQFLDPDVGQIEDVIARANPTGEPRYLIVHGETRYRAALQARLSQIRVTVTEDAGFVRQLLSNETRGDLSLIDKARAYQELIDNHGYSQKLIAKLLGKDQAQVSMTMQLLKLPALTEEAYQAGKLIGLRVIDDMRKLESSHKTPKALATIEEFIEKAQTISRSDVRQLEKKLAVKKSRVNPAVMPMIGGKAFKVLAVEKDGSDDVLSVHCLLYTSPSPRDRG